MKRSVPALPGSQSGIRGPARGVGPGGTDSGPPGGGQAEQGPGGGQAEQGPEGGASGKGTRPEEDSAVRIESEADRHVAELQADNRRLRLEVEELRRAELSHQQAVYRLNRITSAWRATLDALTDPVFLVDRDGNILRANRAIESWQLGSVTAVAGRPLHGLLHPHCDEPRCYMLSLVERFLGMADGSAAPSTHEIDDRVLGRRIRFTARLIETGGRPALGHAHALFVLRDVTAEHLRRRMRSHRDRFETMGRLVRGLAHEIGNPLAMVKTSAQVLQLNFDRFDRDKKEEYLERMLEGIDRIQDIVDRVLEHQQWQIGALEQIPVTALLDRVRHAFEPAMHDRRIEFRVARTAPDLVLWGDLAAVQAVLDVVVRNALEACGAGDEVSVDAANGDDSVRIEIRDSGRGIPSADLERVFQPFFTTKPSRLGLGLTYADQLMDRMDGSIEIESTERVSTSVALAFRPAADTPAADTGR